MNPCACGCGKLVKNRWARGHQYRKGRGNMPVPGVSEPVPTPELQTNGNEPPPYPQPVDRRRWRLASERPGTNPFSPWLTTKCAQCHETMYTRDPTSTYEHAGTCEECEFRLRSEMYEREGRRFNAQARTVHDPFRPR